LTPLFFVGGLALLIAGTEALVVADALYLVCARPSTAR